MHWSLDWLTGGSADPFSDESLSPDSPIGLLANNLVITVMVPAAVLAVMVVHRERVGWLASVVGRPRWGLLARFLGVATVVVVVFFGASFLLPGDAAREIETPSAATLVALLVVILLTTPLQAAAEEVGFRGYLSQAVASWFARPAVGTVVAGAVSATAVRPGPRHPGHVRSSATAWRSASSPRGWPGARAASRPRWRCTSSTTW